MNIGKSIKLVLLDKGMTQRHLAKSMGITEQQMCNICASKTCTGDRLQAIANVFEMPVSELVAKGE